MKNKKGQIFLYEIFVVLIVVFIIIFLEITTISNYITNIKTNKKSVKTLKEILLIEEFISNCDYLATKKTNICYRNNINFNKNIDYDQHNISKIFIDKEIYTNNKNSRCYKRGVIYKNKFKILEVCFYD